MAYLVVCVLNQVDKTPALVEAWTAAGVPGITLLNTARWRADWAAAEADELPMMPSIASILEAQESDTRLAFSVVADEEMVARLADEAEKVAGRLDDPGTGILFSVPLGLVRGLLRRDRGTEFLRDPEPPPVGRRQNGGI